MIGAISHTLHFRILNNLADAARHHPFSGTAFKSGAQGLELLPTVRTRPL